MKKIFLILLGLYSGLIADTFIVYYDKTNISGKYIWAVTACKDGYFYTLIKQEPFDMDKILDDFYAIQKIDKRYPCPSDFKDPSQFPKD